MNIEQIILQNPFVVLVINWLILTLLLSLMRLERSNDEYWVYAFFVLLFVAPFLLLIPIILLLGTGSEIFLTVSYMVFSTLSVVVVEFLKKDTILLDKRRYKKSR